MAIQTYEAKELYHWLTTPVKTWWWLMSGMQRILNGFEY